jgi:hypothetical protein
MSPSKRQRELRLAVPEEFDLEDVIELAEDLRLKHMGVIDAKETNPFQSHWKDADDQTEVIFCDDEANQQAYFILNGPNALALARIFAIELDLWTTKDVVIRLKKVRTKGAVLRNLRRAGILSRAGPNADLLEVIIKNLRSDDPDIREAALAAVANCGWKEFQVELENMATNDDEKVIQESAKTLVEHFESAGWT